MSTNAIVTQNGEELVPSIVAQLVKAGIEVKSVNKINPTLEQLFLQMTEGENIE